MVHESRLFSFEMEPCYVKQVNFELMGSNIFLLSWDCKQMLQCQAMSKECFKTCLQVKDCMAQWQRMLVYYVRDPQFNS